MMEHKIEGGKGGEDREGKGRKGKEREMKGGNGRREGKEGKGWDVREREIPRLERSKTKKQKQLTWIFESVAIKGTTFGCNAVNDWSFVGKRLSND